MTYCPECRHNLAIIDHLAPDDVLIETLYFCPECGYEELVKAEPEPMTSHAMTVTPEAKQRLMDEHGLTEADFVSVTVEDAQS